MRSALPNDPKAMKINIRGNSALEIPKIKIIGLELVKPDEKGSYLARWIQICGRTTANLKLRGWSHLKRVGPGKKYEI